jgi:hypothetical protein
MEDQDTCEHMSNEEYVEHLCLWDYTNGQGSIEEKEAIEEFYETVTLTLQGIPSSNPCHNKLKKKKLEVESIFKMKNDLVNQLTVFIEDSLNNEKKKD